MNGSRRTPAHLVGLLKRHGQYLCLRRASCVKTNVYFRRKSYPTCQHFPGSICLSIYLPIVQSGAHRSNSAREHSDILSFREEGERNVRNDGYMVATTLMYMCVFRSDKYEEKSVRIAER